MALRPELGPNDPEPPPTGDTVSLKKPYIDPRVTDPRALAYRQQLRARKSNMPVGEVPMPPIPRLDQQANGTRPMTMAEAAQQQRASEFMEQGEGIFQQPQQPAMPRLSPNDILPEQARQDRAFIRGNGEMLAINQPGLAMRYGVMRDGVHVPPAALLQNTFPTAPVQGAGRRPLRPETVDGLKQLQQEQLEPLRRSEEEADARRGVGGAAEQLAGKEIGEEERERIKDAISKMDDFDFGNFREMMVRDLLNNEQQRKIVEARLEPISIDDMVLNGTTTQRVPVIPGRFEPTFQTVGGDIELMLKAMIAEEAKSLDYSVQYFTDKYSMMALCCGLKAINNNPLPSHLNESGDFDRDMFNKKFKKVSKFPLPMLASLGVHYFWFDVRCRQCFRMENVKNG